MLCFDRMDRVVTLSSFEEEETESSYQEYWLSRPPKERIEEVDRLRHEFAGLSKMSLDGFSEGLPRILLVVEREQD